MKNLAVILMLLLAHVGATAQYAIGDQATDFSLQGVDGKTVSLSDYADAKGYIVIFTCNTCPFAVAYEDRINALDKKYKPLGFPVIAINPNDPELSPKDNMEAMIQRSADKNFSFPYLLDSGQKIYPQYGAQRTPHVFVLNKEDGNNIVRYIGAIDDNHEDANDVSARYVDDAVDALLKGEAVKTEKTVAIGCDIKVKK
ncbi:MAG TPA: thioredoxin family protein [Sphingobacterium sp.]|jgi:peroxiredoxin|nr:thioredoxin family protein [Sphingobacterium sp.]